MNNEQISVNFPIRSECLLRDISGNIFVEISIHFHKKKRSPENENYLNFEIYKSEKAKIPVQKTFLIIFFSCFKMLI